jgi:hypothetical protein
VLFSPFLHAAETQERPSPDPSKEVRRIGPDLYELGNLRIDAKKRTITCPGRINMDRGGPIELLACTDRGKRHETILVLDVEPLHLQLALLLLDLEMGRNPAVKYPEGSSENERPVADTVAIRVRWKQEGEGEQEAKTIEHPAHDMLHNVKKERPMQPARWAFIGSRHVRGQFGAKVTGSLVVTYHDPLGILELALEEVNSDIWYEANAKVIPEVDTEVEMIIQAPKKKERQEE